MKALLHLLISVVSVVQAFNVQGQDVFADSLGQEHIYTFAEAQPLPIDGYTRLYEKIDSVKHRYPTKECIEGRSYIGFVVEKNGSVSNLEVVKSLTSKHDEEAIRTLKEVFKTARYLPGTVDEVPVRVKMILPIYFTL